MNGSSITTSGNSCITYTIKKNMHTHARNNATESAKMA